MDSIDIGLQATQIKDQNKKFVKEIRREATNLKNRLSSIHQDSLFVRRIHNEYPHLPLIPNLRCGAWYTPPAFSKATAYFKSTDGHMGQWRFSLKRSNIHLVDLIEKEGGAILVDSTRRGKSIPDALSKTIPIWCCVLNEASSRKYGSPNLSQLSNSEFNESFNFNQSKSGEQGGGAWLRTPAEVVGQSEHQQIASKVDGWVKQLLASDLPIPHLELPLLPIFVTPTSAPTISEATLESLSVSTSASNFLPLILLSTSHAISSGQTQSNSLFPNSSSPIFTYVQGAGDDHEAWSLGLTPAMFWDQENHEVLLNCDRDQLEATVKGIVKDKDKRQVKVKSGGNEKWFIPLGSEVGEDVVGESEEEEEFQDDRIAKTDLFIGQRDLDHTFNEIERRKYSLIIHCTAEEVKLEKQSEEAHLSSKTPTSKIANLGIEEGKRGISKFALSVPTIIPIIQKRLEYLESTSSFQEEPDKILICSSDGKDVPGSLAILCLALFFDDSQTPLISSTNHGSFSSTLNASQESQLASTVDSTPFTPPSKSQSQLLEEHRKGLTKSSLQKRLEWLVTSNPNSVPSRSHLKRINEWLLSPKGGRFG